MKPIKLCEETQDFIKITLAGSHFVLSSSPFIGRLVILNRQSNRAVASEDMYCTFHYNDHGEVIDVYEEEYYEEE